MSKILIIEDDVFLRDLIVRKLKQDNFGVLEAVDGEEGYQKLQEEAVDLILLDLVLPGIDGFELLEKIKKDEKQKNTPVIIISNLGEESDIKRGFSLGATDYIVKAQLTPNEIITKVKNVLALKEQKGRKLNEYKK